MSEQFHWFNFLFSWSYFLLFSYGFYKKFFPILLEAINNNILQKQNITKKIHENLQHYQKEYEKHQEFIKNINENIINLGKQKIAIEKNNNIKIKTMKYNYDKLDNQYKEFFFQFLKQKIITEYLFNHKNQLINLLKEDNYDYAIDFNINKTNENHNHCLNWMIIKKIDDLWS